MATRLASPETAAQWLHARVTGALHTDSRKVAAGDGFIAWPGAAIDGRRFVAGALAQGARACLIEDEGHARFGFAPSDSIASYPQLKAACGPIAAAYYEHPSRALAVVAITGTNGKTSTAWWAAAALDKLHDAALAPCGIAGTLGIGIAPNLEKHGLTTPDPVRLQGALRGFVAAGARACAIEASSIGLAEHRLDGTQIRVAAFTNFTQDHLDYHGSMAAYWQAKRALFDWPGLQAAVIDVDDPKGAELADHARARALDVWTVALDGEARLVAREVRQHDRGLGWRVCEAGEELELETPLLGRYNVANVMVVIGVLRALGVPLARAVAACGDLPAVPGRLERIERAGAPLAVVDYAHTPDALAKAAQALRPLAQQRGGALWCVFGCGGNRDRGKRPLMALAAERAADRIVLTSDNPRDEDPQAIIDEVRAGFARPEAVIVETERAAAIARALSLAAAPDVVLIAGKGHEDEQEIAGVRHPFSDQQQARAALARRGQSAEGRT